MRRALPVAKALHWATAIAVLVLFVFGILMTQIGSGAVANFLYSSHKVLGVVTIALLGLRLIFRIWAAARGRWPAEQGGHAIHWLLYCLGIVVGLLGWAGVSDFGARAVFFGLSLPSIWPEGAGHSAWFFQAHVWLAFLMMALIVAHIGLALNDYVTRRAED
jgi:cytochrome b561